MGQYNFPVWGTQGGGLVREIGRDRYIFVEKPDCPGLDVGDYMPEEWGIIPANQSAKDSIDQEVVDELCDDESRYLEGVASDRAVHNALKR